MPYSYPLFKAEVAKHIKEVLNPHHIILDVGAGSGIYADLLGDKFPYIDAIEIFHPYVDMFKLKEKYRFVMVADITEAPAHLWRAYDYIILGDVVEHMDFKTAFKLLNDFDRYGKRILVAVPYLYEQGAEFNNQHETHLQPDLTNKIFIQRYPFMHLLYGDDKYGYYINY